MIKYLISYLMLSGSSLFAFYTTQSPELHRAYENLVSDFRNMDAVLIVSLVPDERRSEMVLVKNRNAFFRKIKIENILTLRPPLDGEVNFDWVKKFSSGENINFYITGYENGTAKMEKGKAVHVNAHLANNVRFDHTKYLVFVNFLEKKQMSKSDFTEDKKNVFIEYFSSESGVFMLEFPSQSQKNIWNSEEKKQRALSNSYKSQGYKMNDYFHTKRGEKALLFVWGVIATFANENITFDEKALSGRQIHAFEDVRSELRKKDFKNFSYVADADFLKTLELRSPPSLQEDE